MTSTGVFASKEDIKKLINLVSLGWQQGETMIAFSVGEGIRKDQATVDAEKICHKLAINYGLPEIQGYYGIKKDGEFVRT